MFQIVEVTGHERACTPYICRSKGGIHVVLYIFESREKELPLVRLEIFLLVRELAVGGVLLAISYLQAMGNLRFIDPAVGYYFSFYDLDGNHVLSGGIKMIYEAYYQVT